jgi:hypothetical protein|tara:strand:- start:2824 stop:3006 length:183 start_codon:yes stop_codon:yes gene_type:complete
MPNLGDLVYFTELCDTHDASVHVLFMVTKMEKEALQLFNLKYGQFYWATPDEVSVFLESS